MENKIKKMILSCGADVCGISGIERFAAAPTGFSPKDIFKHCKSVIAFGKALPKGLTAVEPRLIYGHYNAFICNEVDAIALQGAKYIEEQFGAAAVPMPCDAPYEYWDCETLTGKGLISMKHTAVLCGLGQLGKSSLLLNPKYGTLLTVGAILTNLELCSDKLCAELCIKGCTRCVDVCPVSAIQDGKVNQLLCRQNTYGKTARGFDTVDCNRCRTVCPMKFGR
ncbi:MAG: epoxyqueuosine reductase [Christensenellaceae bacterium]